MTDLRERRIPNWLTLPMMLGSGALVTIQSHLNGVLAHDLGTGLRATALAALISLWLIPTYGWRAIFVAGVIPAGLLFFVRRYMPESVRYLLSRGKVAEAERTVEQMATALRRR